ncbi:putative 5'-3' exonuclease [Cafeteria roenbergensis virus]|uniref:Putative 5'-3' exonuclease n=1 Tax=Cafeteria roenbergensis virus (strain BV-PW1) TaxID=693272 RepID=E3T575_CROVB|nr:putative 5'-3' exonuclease [Cafeteria roenbergensis virus BV-PW1]ADO67338.1 putative 5'-3' exonuclease [Cafeteria roenbergensis virus BV-PW1]
MGVPGFFLWLMKNYKKNKFVNNINEFNKTDFKWLCLDANCLIHPKCFEVLAENPDFKNLNSLENKMISRCLEYIEKLVLLVKPTEGLYIAVDGVAPVAKIKQQRSRRFKSVSDNALYDRLKDKHNIPKNKFWNNSSITPGTDFMMKITKYIKEWATKQSYKIIFSSGNTPGEGEHKILDFIRQRQINYTNELNSGPYVIYGLDADLIFLSIALNRNDVYLMREAEHLNKGKGDILQLIDLEVMKESINYTMLQMLEGVEIKPTKTQLINDFIFICYFLGNDFLPHYQSLDIYDDGLPILLKTYATVISNTILPILKIQNNSTVQFNQKTLIEFIKLLAEQEEDILLKISKKHIYKPRLEGTDYEKEVKRIEWLRFKINDPVRLGEGTFDDYSKRYYEHYFYGSNNENIIKICYEYIKGLTWVTNYYFYGVPSWDYYYPYDQAPFLKDLSKVINLLDMTHFKFKKGTPLKPLEQLLAVMPPQSKYLLPTKVQRLFNEESPLGHLYPIDFKQDFIHKRKYWQGIPLLPFLEIDTIQKEFSKIEKTLTPKDLHKNRVDKEFIYNN